MIIGHARLTEYLHRFKNWDNPICLCLKNSKSVVHILRDCVLLQLEEDEFLKVILYKLKIVEIIIMSLDDYIFLYERYTKVKYSIEI